MILDAVRRGLRRAGSLWGLVALLLAVNLLAAALLAVPLALRLRDDLSKRAAATSMLYGFDYAWWVAWSDEHPDSGFGPDVFGTGFAFKNLDLLLRGHLPAGLFVLGDPDDPDASRRADLDATVLALAVAYMVLQVFLAGGVLAALRAPQPTWTLRGVLHGSGFYFGRLLRLAALALAAVAVVFLLYGPFARWADTQAREAVSERTAMAWLLGRHLLLLLALLAVNMVASYARVLIVLEERTSAVLAFLSAAVLCASHFFKTFGHVLLMAAVAAAGLAVWGLLDRHWETTGYKTQAVTFLLLEGLVFLRIFLRVALLGGQVSLARRLAGGGAEPA
ncbi:MAG TPA: hypothetical protein VMR21_04830 [Vicinamibacteria bacterium]|nr:hypothetical protein [Vicinamibacteria bacterium]